jgi:hypothetical protein
LTRRILWRALQLHANALGRRAADWREVSRFSEEVGGDENRRPFILEPDDDDDLYSRPPPKKGIQKEPEEPKIRSREHFDSNDRDIQGQRSGASDREWIRSRIGLE